MTDKKPLIDFIKGSMAIAILIVILIYFNKPANDVNSSNKERLVREKSKERFGKIIRTYGWKDVFFVLQDSSSFSPECLTIVRQISVGDSIYKPAGTFDVYIYKKCNPDSVIFIKCDVDLDWYDLSREEQQKIKNK